LWSGEASFIERDRRDDNGNLVGFELNLPENEAVCAMSMNITLGSGGLQLLTMDVVNCTILIDFDDSANLIDSQISISGDSSTVIGVTLTDKVSFGDEGLFLGLLCGVLYMDLDLPSGLNGEFEFWSTTEINPWSISGWSRDGNSYVTESTDSPLVSVSTNAEIAHIWLNA
jgi:hypothetical protein